MDFEKDTQESVDVAQVLEYAIMIVTLNQFIKYINNSTDKQLSEGTNKIRKEAIKQIALFQTSIKKSVEKVVNDKHSVLMLENVAKYVKSNGIVLGNQKLETFFYNLCKDEVKGIVEGTKALDDAIISACEKLGDKGVSVVTYDNTTRKIDVFVRQELIYAQKQSYQDKVFQEAKERGITVFETDAHPNARPTHQAWQGRRWDTTGKLYPIFEQLSHGNGDYNDYNCQHVVSPVGDPTSPPQYTEEQLANINTKPFTYKGKLYDGYSAKQHMRALERQIRALKRQQALIDTTDIKYEKVAQRLKLKEQDYNNFAKAFGTYPRTNRTRVVTQ